MALPSPSTTRTTFTEKSIEAGLCRHRRFLRPCGQERSRPFPGPALLQGMCEQPYNNGLHLCGNDVSHDEASREENLGEIRSGNSRQPCNPDRRAFFAVSGSRVVDLLPAVGKGL